MSDRQQLRVMLERPIDSYGKGIPYLEDTRVKGRLIVIEGPDASGRSTQITTLTSKLEADGHAVLNTGLRRSELISQGILEAKRNFVLGKRTISLFYAADFADQLENKIIPALRSGSFLIYQGLLAKQFRKMQKKYGLVPINGNRSILEINKDLQNKIDDFLKISLHAPTLSHLRS